MHDVSEWCGDVKRKAGAPMRTECRSENEALWAE